MQHFEDTDTLYVEFKGRDFTEPLDLHENTPLDLDAEGNLCAITIEHASKRKDVNHLHVEGIAA